MNEDKWNEISPEDQAAIEEISGRAFAERVGEAWNAADEAALEEIKDAGIEISDAPQPVLEEIKSIASDYEQQWADSIADDGFDGTAALEEMRAKTGVSY
jgi:TRAP-type C4-dicarboxylate transport system substrate-binding protein